MRGITRQSIAVDDLDRSLGATAASHIVYYMFFMCAATGCGGGALHCEGGLSLSWPLAL